MPPCAIVETDIAKTETTKELHFKIELHVVGEVETVFSRRHDVVEADDAHKNSDDFEILKKNIDEPTHIQYLQFVKTLVERVRVK